MAVGKGPLNYTTTVDPGKTAMECIAILSKHGAAKVGLSLGEDRIPDGLEFVISTPFGPRAYLLPVNTDGAVKVLYQAWRDGKIPKRFSEPVQARRVAWRTMKDWLAAQMALIEVGMVDLPQIMLPYMKTNSSKTVYELWREHELREIEQGS